MYQSYFDGLAHAKESKDEPNCIDQTAKYATPALAARLARANIALDPVFDWDFLIAAQDRQDLRIVSVALTSSTNTAATVRIETSNFGTVSDSDVELSKADAAWQVADIVFWPGTTSETSLDTMLKAAGL